MLSGFDDAAWASPWRQARVGEKVAISGALVISALVLPWPAPLVVAAVSACLLVGAAKVRPSLVAGGAALPTSFIVISAIATAVALGPAPPDALWSWGWVSITSEGLRTAGTLAARGLAGTMAVFVLAMTTPMVDLLSWLRRFRIPDAVLEIASLTYRMIFGAWNALLAVRAAQLARLGDTGTLRTRYRMVASGLGSVALRSWQQAERLNAGLAGRGFESSLRTLPREATRRVWPIGAVSVVAVWAIWWWTRR